jgi:hypothetical protein
VKLHNERVFDPLPPPTLWYPLGAVPTIGLPLLMDFRTYPNVSIVGTNRLLGIFAIFNPLNPPQEIAPFFTAYTQGGIPIQSGIPITIDPDLQIVAAGGIPANQVGTMPRNQFIMFGQGDFVTRVSRAHTRWFECAPNAAGSGFSFSEPVIDRPSLSCRRGRRSCCTSAARPRSPT